MPCPALSALVGRFAGPRWQLVLRRNDQSVDLQVADRLQPGFVHRPQSDLDETARRTEHVFDMPDAITAPRLVHRTARIRLRLTRPQADRCYRLLRSAGDVWAWLLDRNRERLRQGELPVTNYQALCRELTRIGSFGELSVVRSTVCTAPLRRRLVPGCQTPQPRRARRLPAAKACPGPNPLLPRHL